MLNHTIFINLKERTDRYEHVLKELAKMNIQNPVRLDATRHQIGAIGCTISHIRALEHAKNAGWSQVFVCEDDITFLNTTLLRENIEKFSQKNIPWNVLIIGGNNCPPYEIIDDGCCRVFNCQTTTGYIVHKDYYDVLIQNFRESANHLLREPTNHRQYALDIYWKRLQKTGAWYMILPLSVIQYENYSDIERKSTNYSWLMLDMEKRWLRGFPPK
jgi:glycosyl transferase family 25